MTNDEAGNRVMIFLAEQLSAFLKMSRSSKEDESPTVRDAGLGAFMNNVISSLSSGELGKAMEILIDANRPIPETWSPANPPGTDIKAWLTSILEGAGGLKNFHKYELGGSRSNIHDAANWTVRCLANPKCAGSGTVVQAILDERARKLGLPDDMDSRIAGGLLAELP